MHLDQDILNKVHRSLSRTEIPVFSDVQSVLELASQMGEAVHHSLFEGPDAWKEIFENASPIPSPDINWFHTYVRSLNAVVSASACTTVTEESPPPRDLLPEEERALFLQYNYARFRLSAARSELDSSLRIERVQLEPISQCVRWLKLALNRRECILNYYLRFVIKVAQQFEGRSARRTAIAIPRLDELIGAGLVGLLDAIDKFDIQKHPQLKEMAGQHVANAIRKILGPVGPPVVPLDDRPESEVAGEPTAAALPGWFTGLIDSADETATAAQNLAGAFKRYCIVKSVEEELRLPELGSPASKRSRADSARSQVDCPAAVLDQENRAQVESNALANPDLSNIPPAWRVWWQRRIMCGRENNIDHPGSA
jgi:hypothetical protein